MKHQLQVAAKTGIYPVHIGPGLCSELGYMVKSLRPQAADVFIITDTHVEAAGYTTVVEAGLRAQGLCVQHASLPPGDESKSLEQCAALYRALLAANVRRDGVIIALGGGVIGDIAGFVAATYLRGIAFIQAPTTLLAHDSSIGGKVGVNLDAGKNLVGAFYPPIAVVYDTDCLGTLPDREWRNGMAEVIKHGLIGDAELFRALSDSPVASFPGSEAAADLVARAANVKVNIVERDEHEHSLRMVLNLGHTVGHAVEKLSSYSLGHGEAIAIGMAVESELATNLGYLPAKTAAQIRAVLESHGLPTRLPDYPRNELMAVMNVDKKHAAAGWTFALPYGIGDVRVCRNVPQHLVERCLTALSA